MESLDAKSISKPRKQFIKFDGIIEIRKSDLGNQILISTDSDTILFFRFLFSFSFDREDVRNIQDSM